MQRTTTAGLLAALTLLTALTTACSEPLPEQTSTTGKAATTTACEGAQLMDCARASSIGDLVPDAPKKASGTPITLGMINQENTPAGSFPELSKAAQAALDFINENLDGVDGRPIELDVCNTKFSTEGSTTCGQQFVDDEVPAVLGGIDVFGNGVDVLAKNGIPFVGGIPVSTQSVQAPNSFQWSGGSWGATVAFADYAATKLKAKNVAIVYSEFGSITQAAEYGQTVLEANDVEVEMVPFPIMSTDIATPLQAADANDPDAIMLLAADTACKAAFDAFEAQKFFTGACASPTIIDPLDAAKTDGTIFNVEGPIIQGSDNPDPPFYAATVEEYGDGLDPVGAGTVTFRAVMNLYRILRDIGADDITPKAVTEALAATDETPSFMGHAYTCDREQFEGLPAICSPQQILAKMQDKSLTQLGGWIDVGAIYAG